MSSTKADRMKQPSRATQATVIASSLILAGGYVAYQSGDMHSRSKTIMSSSKSKQLGLAISLYHKGEAVASADAEHGVAVEAEKQEPADIENRSE
jgi:hypothetical protein